MGRRQVKILLDLQNVVQAPFYITLSHRISILSLNIKRKFPP